LASPYHNPIPPPRPPPPPRSSNLPPPNNPAQICPPRMAALFPNYGELYKNYSSIIWANILPKVKEPPPSRPKVWAVARLRPNTTVLSGVGSPSRAEGRASPTRLPAAGASLRPRQLRSRPFNQALAP